MSLLQEALKRKEEDQSQDKPEAVIVPGASGAAPVEKKIQLAGPRAPEGITIPIPQPSPPQSMPVVNQLRDEAAQSLLASAELALGEASLKAGPLAKPGRRKSSMLWVIVAVIAIFISATITAGFVYFFYRFLPSSKAKVVQAVPLIVPPVPLGNTNQVSAQPAPEQPPAIAGSVETAAHAPGAPDVKEQPAAADALTQAVASAESTVAQRPAAGVAGRKPVSVKPAFFKTKEPAAAPAVQWPLLKLSGILRGSGKNENTALINGKMINIGQTIENVTLVEIQSDGVILKYGAEQRFLRVGAVSY